MQLIDENMKEIIKNNDVKGMGNEEMQQKERMYDE
jgi:hypothetical protein